MEEILRLFFVLISIKFWWFAMKLKIYFMTASLCLQSVLVISISIICTLWCTKAKWDFGS